MLKSTRRYNGTYLVTDTENIRLGFIVMKDSEGWRVLSQVTGDNIFNRFKPFKTKRSAMWAIRCHFFD